MPRWNGELLVGQCRVELVEMVCGVRSEFPPRLPVPVPALRPLRPRLLPSLPPTSLHHPHRRLRCFLTLVRNEIRDTSRPRRRHGLQGSFGAIRPREHPHTLPCHPAWPSPFSIASESVQHYHNILERWSAVFTANSQDLVALWLSRWPRWSTHGDLLIAIPLQS